MSFRLRVLGLVVLVAVSATAATAWLTLRQASEQINDSAVADRAQIEEITQQLTEYGRQRGSWLGVPDLVMSLHGQTGQRIHLVSEFGTVIVDTDTVNGLDARPLGQLSFSIDPRPTLSLAENPSDPVAATTKIIRAYRENAALISCLNRHAITIAPAKTELGVTLYDVADPADLTAPNMAGPIANCRKVASEQAGIDPAPVKSCADPHRRQLAGQADPPTDDPTTSADALATCLAGVFTEQISDVTAVPARVYIGASGDPGPDLAAGPLLAAAAGVAAVAIIGTALVSHRVLRPIGTLTTAAQRLGRGDLSGRVPVEGNDELAELARSFNRMADSLQQGEERQRRLVADVAHELRTPLVNLRGYLEALKDGVIEPDIDLFTSLHEEAVLQQRIVDDLQVLALAEAGRLVYHRVDVDLAELLETCRTAHLARAESAGLTLAVRAEPVEVRADPDRLRQVIGNLITNAVRATSPGGEIVLSVAPASDAIVVQVTDTGTGIAAESLPYVFDRFWRADSARGRRTGGSGLGLAITRQIVTDHGGSITVASEVEVGTTFTITLPRTAPSR